MPQSNPMIVLLPGLDGTGELFLPFLTPLPEREQVRVVRYPTDRFLNYPELERYVLKELPVDQPITLIAESFSGPIALRVSANRSLNLRAVVVVCSFAYRPFGLTGSVLGRIPLPWFFKLRIHPVFLRSFLVGRDAPDELVAAINKALSSVQPNVLASRLKEILKSEYCAERLTPATRVIALFSKRDRLLGERGRRSIVRVCPTVEAYELDTPHLALQVAPEQVSRILSDLDLTANSAR